MDSRIAIFLVIAALFAGAVVFTWVITLKSVFGDDTDEHQKHLNGGAVRH